MKIKIPYTFTECVIPKRCRKPRDVSFNEILDVEVKEIEKHKAPVAIIEHQQVFHYPPIVFRWFDGRLWTDVSTWSPNDGKYESINDCFRSDHWKTQASVIKQLNECAANVIIIDQQIFQTASEPRYVVMTFGLGCNHGGTALMTDHHYNSNIGKAAYYRIDQREEAMAEAERVAIARGDTKDVPIDPAYNFDVLIPEAIQLNPAEHGDGDPFINSIENIIQTVKSPIVAGLFAISKTLS